MPGALEATALGAKQLGGPQLSERDNCYRGLRGVHALHEMLEPLRNIGSSVSALLCEPPKRTLALALFDLARNFPPRAREKNAGEGTW